MKSGIEDTVGKTISGIVVAERDEESPRFQQVFLVFTDGYYLELYGIDIRSAGGLDKGDINDAIKYTSIMGTTVKRIRTAESVEKGSHPQMEITQEQALKIIEDYFIKLAKLEANRCEITSEKPTFSRIYGTWPEDEEVWYVYPESRGDRTGASRVIVISKRTGKILFDGKVGE